jgi:fibronectin type 3 domain-containing protein
MVNPVTPTRLTIYPKVVGTPAPNTAVVQFFKDASCNQPIGSGTASKFMSTGIEAGVIGNATTTIYAEDLDQAGNVSACTHMVDYVNNTIPPDPPVFNQAMPPSPNNQSYTPLITGTTSTITVQVKFFSDSQCRTQIGQGLPSDFASTGITITAGINTTTSVFGESIDNVGNVSACTLLTSYAYSNLAAPNPTYNATNPVSPSNISTTPSILGAADHTVTTVSLYSDSTCSTKIGHGTRPAFATSGIAATVSPNAVTTIYGQSTDIYANISACVLLTSYMHDNIPPLDPTFTTTSPLSPNNTSATPLILGTAPSNPASLLPVSTLSLYDSSSCINELGSGTPAAFASTGIEADVYPNATTSIYAQSNDAAGNRSNCIAMTSYVYDNLPPGKPQFLSASPASPSYSLTSVFTGNLGSTIDFESASKVSIFSDSVCSISIGSGSASAFTSTGITITVPENATTTIFGKTTDVVGNQSVCNTLTNFQESDQGPAQLSGTLLSDGSVNLTWLPDNVAQPPPTYSVGRAVITGGPYTTVATALNSTSFRDLSVTANTTYYYVVWASNVTGSSKLSTEISVPISVSVPPAPTGLAAISGPSQVSLSWSGNSSSMMYSVYRSSHSGGPYTLLSGGQRTTTYIDTAVISGTPYFYVVTGVNPAGESAFSNEINIEPLNVPNAPTQLTLSVQSYISACANHGIVLNWGAPSYYQSFNIKRSTGSGSESTFTTTTSNHYIDCSPNTNSPNYYTVTANWGSQESAPSNEVGFVSDATPALTVYPGNTVGALSWTAMSGASSYTVFRGLSSGGPYNTNFSGISSTSYQDPTVTNGLGYYYVVQAVYSGGFLGWPSGEANMVPGPSPSPPTNLDINITSNVPNLNWSAPSNYNSFNVYRATTQSGSYSFIANTGSSNFQDSSPLTGMNWYKVTASWGNVETAATSAVSFRNGVPTNVTASPSPTAIALTWTGVTGAQNYSILRSTTYGGPYTLANYASSSPYKDTAITIGTGYYYVLQSNFADGTQSQYSSQVSSMAGSSTVPSGLTATNTTSSSVQLQWTAVTGATKYKIYQSTTSGGPWIYTNITPATTTATVPSLTFNKTYYFAVTSVIGSTESGKSTQTSALTVGQPSSPQVTPNISQVAIQWSGVAGATSYSVLRSTDSVNFTAITVGVSSTTTNFNDTTVTNGKIYFYKISAVFTTVTLTSASSSAVTPGTIPPAPAGITFYQNGAALYVTWASVNGVTGYNVYSSTSSGGPYTLALGNVGSGLQYISGASYSTSPVYFVVTSLQGGAESAYSPQAAWVFEAPSPAPTVVAGSNGTVNVSWSPVTGASTYDVQRSVDGINFTAITLASSSTTYLDSGLTNGKTYYYQYVPRVSGGVQMNPSAVSSPVTPGVTALVPALLTADATTTSQVNLNWVSIPNVTSYNVYRGGSSGGPYGLLTNVTSPTISYADTGVSAGNTYYYVVTSLNLSGVESGNSNEAGIMLLSAPTNLSAIGTDNQIALTWNAVSGAASYIVKRAQSSSGPFGIVATSITMASYTDTQVVSGDTFYYEVEAVSSTGIISPDSAVASAGGIVTVNLQIPVELTDGGLSSLEIPTVFARTQTSFDPAAYDGTLSYYFESVALNTDSVSHTVGIYDIEGNPCGSITVPASTTSPTRIRSTFTPDSVFAIYELVLDGTTSPGQLQVLSSRFLVNQNGASRSKIYIPLLSSSSAPSTADAGAMAASTSATTYSELPAAILYKRSTTNLSSLANFNAWALETVSSASNGATGTLGLYDVTQGALVLDTQTDFSSSNPEIALSPFDEGVTNFAAPTNEGDSYEMELTCASGCSTGSVALYKAGLWVTLNPLTKAEIIFRNMLAANLSNTSIVNNERTLIDPSLFSNPNFFFSGVVQVLGSGTANLLLMNAGAQESGTSGLTAVSGSSLNFSSSSKTKLQTASPLSLSGATRYLPQVTPGTTTANVISTSLVIDISH